jgi:CHAT domain-containing protein
LHYLPFAALSGGDGYLIDHYDLRVLPNASVLKFLKGGPKEGERKSLILGNPDLGDPKYSLKYAQEESLSISRILPGALLLLGSEARAAYVQRNGGQFQFIHFAAHGLFDPENPLNSALLLAKDQGHDGRLRAGDLYSLNLNAELVTLSACETALSKVSKGDDVVGFTRGFLYAGSRAIVSSLWKVDDLATRDLMVGFYANLARMPKDEALRLAQFKVREKYPHPFYWAAFQLTGLTQ